MSIESSINQRIQRLQAARHLLSNPEMLSLIREVLAEQDRAASPSAAAPTPTAAPASQSVTLHLRGAMTKIAYDCIQAMGNEPFIATELIDRMRAAGYQFSGHPSVSMFQVLRKFAQKGFIRIVEQGIGRRATVYQRKEDVG